jgi:outer membrane protein TolC
MSLKLFLQDVQKTYPVLRAARQDRVIADADLLSAEGAFDVSWKTRATAAPLGYYRSYTIDTVVQQPTRLWGVTAFAGWRLGRGDFAIYDGKRATNELGEVRAGLQIPLWRDGSIDRRRANIERAEIGQKVSELAIEQQRIEATRSASLRYWSWVTAGQRVAVAKQLLDAAVARDAGLAARADRGDLPPIERTENTRSILQRQSQVLAAERALQQAAIELSLFHRDQQDAPIVLGPSTLPRELPEPSAIETSIASDLARAQARRPEARRFSLQREQASVDLAWARNQTRPSIDLQLLVSRDLGEGAPYRRPTELEAGILIDIPLQNRVADGRADAAYASIVKATAQEQMARDRIAADVKDARSEVETARQRVSIARQELELARQLEAFERRRFELGDSTLLIVNLREQAAAEAAMREIDALGDFQRARAALRSAMGITEDE